MREPQRTHQACRVILAASMLLLPWSVAGKDGQDVDTNGPAPAAAPQLLLTKPELQLQLEQVKESVNLSDDAKAKATGILTQAIGQLEIAEQWTAKAAEFESERQKAPERLAAIQAELAKPFPEPGSDIPADATRADLELRLHQVQSDLDNEKKTLADWERERDQRTTRRKEIPELVAAAKARILAITEPAQSPEDDPSAIVRAAQRSLVQARRLAIEREIEAYNSELLSYDARRDLLQARLDRATRRVNHAEKTLAVVQKRVQEKAHTESVQTLRDAREQLKQAHPAIRPLIEEREKLALGARELQNEIKSVDQRVSDTDAQLAQLSLEFDKINRRVNVTGLTNAIGQLLRKHRGNLPSIRPIQRDLRQGKDRISAVQLIILELEDRRSELIGADAIVSEVMEEVGPDEDAERRAMIEQAATEAITNLRTDTGTLLKEYDRLFDKLVDLDSKERELVVTIERFKQYVDEKVLWIRSGATPHLSDIRQGRDAFVWLVSPSSWGNVLRSIGGTARANAGWLAVSGLLLFAIWTSSGRFRRFVREAGERVNKLTRDNMLRTVGVLFASAFLAVRWPATLWFVGWVIASPPESTDFSKAISSGLSATAVILLTLQSLRQIARINGLGEKHFRWNAQSLKLLKLHIAWLTPILVPTFFVFSTLEAQGNEAFKGSLGRATFVVAFLAIALFIQRVLRPSGPVLGPVLQRQSASWLNRLRHVWFTTTLALPLLLVIAAVMGYYYTSLYLGTRFIESVWLLVGLIVGFALVKRWLVLQIRRRAIAEAQERAAQKQQKVQESEGPTDPDVVSVPEERLDVVSINKQTLQLVRVMMMVIGIGGLWAIWADALPALGVLRGVTLWSITHQVSETITNADGKTIVNEVTKIIPITLANLGLVSLTLLITVVAVKNVPGLLEITILQRLPIDAGGRFTATAITRYLITVTGVIVAFGQIGVGWAQVQWLVAAMTVGLGFGLQEIFANLASGLMLLIERPIRIGDTVTVSDTVGTVTRIRTRATTVVGWDRKELIIPNKEFITGRVVNWTLSDSVIRLIVPVGIAYGSDTKLAKSVMSKIVENNQNVLDDPPPRILFMGFGESSLDFEVRAYVGSIDHYMLTIDELHFAIDQEFRKAGIEIAFPQRDIHVRSVQDAFTVVRDQSSQVPKSE
ncbi:MAG TPA: mechanosensitive ion channel [Phycisphaerae bacterium]|nr:mechanosensitive ion channel [Phycisphaerae bacterium]